ncbi:MAG: protein kinase [Myxococcales bacterium]|nr:protein kinase [Myxococcales bacterium]
MPARDPNPAGADRAPHAELADGGADGATLASAEPIPRPPAATSGGVAASLAAQATLAAPPRRPAAAETDAHATLASAEPIPAPADDDALGEQPTLAATPRPRSPARDDLGEQPTLAADAAPLGDADTIAVASASPSPTPGDDDERATFRFERHRSQAPDGDPAAGASLPAIDRDGYAIGSVFARGGIGRILRARDRTLDRPVALKELLVRSPHAEERFIREALITARLQHPGIVPIYEAGRWPTGEPFYAMKLVSGRPLADAIDEATTFEARMALLPHVLAVAETMAYAHSRRIIHRDLKPENVLLGAYGETVVIDWGLAKELDRPDDPAGPAGPSIERRTSASSNRRRLPIAKDLTMVGSVMGTPAYMPPEQAYGDPVDERADVYALGAILYHVLAGEPPFDGETAMAILVQVTSEAPVPIEVRQPALPRELAAIIAKAMAYDPAERYPNAGALADDLRRFATGQLVAAHHYSTRERLLRLLQRYRAPLLVAAVSLLILAVVSTISVRRVLSERDEARRLRIEAEASRDAARRASEESERARALSQAQADALALDQARLAAAEQPSRTIELLAGISDKREWGRLRTIAADAVAHGLGAAYHGHLLGASRNAFSPDGRRLVTSGDDCAAALWDLETGEGRRLLGHRDEVWRVLFSPDGREVVTTSRDATIRRWDAATGAPLGELRGHEAGVRIAAYTDDGRLLSGGDDNRLLRWDLATGASELLAECLSGSLCTDGARVGCVAVDRRSLEVIELASGARHRLTSEVQLAPLGDIAPEGDEIAVGAYDGSVLLWRWGSGKRTRLHPGEVLVRTVLYTPDGARIVAAGADREVWVWRRHPLALERTFSGHHGRVNRLAVSPTSRLVASVGGENGVRLWDMFDGSGEFLADFDRNAIAVAFSPDGLALSATSVDGEARVWRRPDLLRQDLASRLPPQAQVAVDPGLPRLAAIDHQQVVTLWDLADETQLWRVELGIPLLGLAFTPTGDRIVGLGDDSSLVVIDAQDGAYSHHPAPAPWPSFGAPVLAPDGRYLVGSSREGVMIWDLNERSARAIPSDDGDSFLRARAIAPASEWLATGGGDTGTTTDATDRVLRLTNLHTGASEIVDRHPLSITALAFSPDGRLLLSGGHGGDLRIYDRVSGEVAIHPISGLYIRAIQPFADGRRVALINGENAILIWDRVDGRVARRLNGHNAPVRSLILADADTIASQAEDNEIRIWDVTSGESRALGTMPTRLSNLYWHPSRRLVGITVEGHIGIWRDDLPMDQVGFLTWLSRTEASLDHTIDDLSPAPGCVRRE